MRQTPVNDYLEDISTELPEEIYGCLSDAIYETVCEFDEEVAQLKAENSKLRDERERLNEFIVSLADAFNINGEWADVRWCLSGCMHMFKCHPTDEEAKIRCPAWARMRELGVEVCV